MIVRKTALTLGKHALWLFAEDWSVTFPVRRNPALPSAACLVRSHRTLCRDPPRNLAVQLLLAKYEE